MLKRIFFVALAIGCLLVARTQTWAPRYIGMTGATHGYNEYLPEGYRSDGTAVYPLILYIHGNSERGTGDSADLAIAASRGIEKSMHATGFPTSFTVNGHTYRFIVIAPQFEPRPSTLDVDSVLSYVLAHYPVDRNRIYLTGFSMGGGSCWDYAGCHPALANKLAALVPISGSGVPDTIKTRTIARANLPVWATHNDSDQTVPVTTTITYVNWINQSPAPNPLAKMTIFHSFAHEAWPETYDPTFKENGLNVFEWMLQYKKRPLSPATEKQIKVNVYRGSYPYVNGQWNNWNVNRTDSLTSSKLRYNDGTASLVYTVLSNSTSVSDNGPTYGGGMAAAEVLRHTSLSTTARNLTLHGLSRSSTYSLELYASRNNNSGYVTVFVVGDSSRSVPIYYNFTNKAVFTNLKPDTVGNLAVTIKSSNYYNMLNGFALTEKFASVNQPPTAYAGSDKTITLPTNSLTLSGSGSDKDGSIKSYKWAKGAGPIPFNICSPTSTTTTISGLAVGTYTFQLTVTDNKGATALDEVDVRVKAATTKYIRVNLYGGSNPEGNKEWNNWNVVAGTTSGEFHYFNDSASSITATLRSTGVADNGGSYGACMATAGALRYASYGSSARTLTLNGLSPSNTYNLELYASRNGYSGDSTVFTINGISKKIGTYQNRSKSVFFTGLIPNAQGQLVVTISSTKTYNYLNGFTLIQSGTAPVTYVQQTDEMLLAEQL